MKGKGALRTPTGRGLARAGRQAPRSRRRVRPEGELSGQSAVDWIIAKRDGQPLAPAQIEQLVRQFSSGEVADYQMSAWLMAVYFRGLDLEETAALTAAMLHSGRRLEHRGTTSPKVDKHSTGGVGDKLSLCLAPLAAACGVAVPMIAGRGLGHTGGTLDKLESIPGYRTRLPAREFERIVRRIGVSIIGQTDELAPADARIYALRDVTGTVPSAPLITASILSKKLAAGLDALVMDVKVGRGAFMPDLRAARALTRLLTQVGRRLGLPVHGLFTDMSAPIGLSIGNALEVREAIDVLRGTGPVETRQLTLALGVELLLAARRERDAAQAERRLLQALSSGAAAERFEHMIALHGGDPRVVAEPARLPRARQRVPVLSAGSGYVSGIDARVLGDLAVALGAGRTRADQSVDPAVGIELCTQRGLWVEAGQPLAFLHLQSSAGAREWQVRAASAFSLSERRGRHRPRVLRRIEA